MSYTDNLDQYKSYPPTTSCYLDGRYFNKVFARYPGLITSPLNVYVVRDRMSGDLSYRTHMNEAHINNAYPGLLRVIINTPEGRHSSLLIIDYRNAKIFRFDPYGRNSPYFDQVNAVIEKYLDTFLNFQLYIIDDMVPQVYNPRCDVSGYCLAFVIKYAYDYLNRRPFDGSEIMRFSNLVEQMYGPLPVEGKDVEYGLFGNDNPNQGRNMVIGSVGGLALGGLLAGPGGALLGLGTGALIGSAL
jgi:hypothetical protein